MSNSVISELIEKEIEKIKSFLLSRDLLIFLFFVVLSAGMWVLWAAHQEYETIVRIPLRYTNVNEGYVQTKKLPETLLVTVNDGGTTLLRYRTVTSFEPVEIDVSTLLDGDNYIETMSLAKVIQKQLNSSTKIVKTSPEEIEFNLQELKQKEVAVVARLTYTIAQQYVQTDSAIISPCTVTMLAPEDIIDSIQYAYTDSIYMQDIKDTATVKMKLTEIENVTFIPGEVSCIIKTEPYTEKEIEVPIKHEGIEHGFRMRTFPSTAKVKCHIGLSEYKKFNSNTVKVKANCKKVTEDGKIKLDVTCTNKKAQNIIVSPSQVDFILEKEKEIDNNQQ